MILTFALCPSSWAQQENRRETRGRDQNPTANQDKNRGSTATETIRGVIAGITAEGEAMFDYRNNRAVAAEGAFLTVVGSPATTGAESTRATAAVTEERGSANRKRHNVYYVWMTPKTTVFECTETAEASRPQAGTQRAEQKREVSFDNLEVGDHVEIQFALRDDTTSTGSAHQSEQMRRKHGRHRTHVGYATEVTIVPTKDAAAHGAGGDKTEKRGSR
jgi:hypothetical protein